MRFALITACNSVFPGLPEEQLGRTPLAACEIPLKRQEGHPYCHFDSRLHSRLTFRLRSADVKQHAPSVPQAVNF